MLKTITTFKQLRLDELIKYIFEEKIKGEGDYGLINFHSDADTDVEVNRCGQVSVHGLYSGNELFPIETEEEITEDTLFEQCVVLLKNGAVYVPHNCNIKYIKENYKKPRKAYAVINENLELIWECED